MMKFSAMAALAATVSAENLSEIEQQEIEYDEEGNVMRRLQDAEIVQLFG